MSAAMEIARDGLAYHMAAMRRIWGVDSAPYKIITSAIREASRAHRAHLEYGDVGSRPQLAAAYGQLVTEMSASRDRMLQRRPVPPYRCPVAGCGFTVVDWGDPRAGDHVLWHNAEDTAALHRSGRYDPEDAGRVHDIARAELLARDEDAGIERVDPDDPTSMIVPVPGDRVLLADGGTAQVHAQRVHGTALRLQVRRPGLSYSTWVGLDEIVGYPEPALVQLDRDAAAARVLNAALAWEAAEEAAPLTAVSDELEAAVRDYRDVIGGEG